MSLAKNQLTIYITNPPTSTPTLTQTLTPTLTPTPTITPTPNSFGNGTCWHSVESWASYTVAYSIDRNTIPVSKGWDSSIHSAAQTWNAVVPSHFEFTYSTESDNTISFGELQDPNRHAAEIYPFVLTDDYSTRIIGGATVISSSLPIIPDANPPTRLDWDTNNLPIESNPDSNGSTTTLNVKNVVTHEFGHWLFLKDIKDTNCEQVTMDDDIGFGELIKIDLDTADENAINWQYP
ncbi:MAG TPA: matrixin family metalloprotease [Anaerolineales bacterium]|nr:matrixin family metalloprotease [Anaerolineales bacterium]